ncbi:carboxymuconolactone decarboxylase family protein [Pantoea sp. 1.19]|uniref:carboxymuconolactone decarboxylase family protein n=1 Tax=Pantoea sp. 1.19 TaxID=1925589 RepID=UPI000948CC78|nr:carboxymuconolactone decarboxylase family protein [Pantoea sp. 1.19]
MLPRLPYADLSPDAYQGLLLADNALHNSPLGTTLVALLYLRVSQINGCAYCLERHARTLRADGVSQHKLDALAGWRVSPRFSARERAALQWAESLVHIAYTHAPDGDFATLQRHFSDREISDITLAVALMSAFNRLAIGMRQ